jgi:hypothetical protein
MSSPEAYDAIMDRLAEWDGDAPVGDENQWDDAPGSPTPFVYVETFGASLTQETIGAPRNNQWVETGVTYLHVMVRRGTGSRDARAMAASLCNLFRERPAGDLYVDEMEIGSGEPGREFPGYYAMTATLVWHRRDLTQPG